MSYNSTENLGGQKSLDILSCEEQSRPGNDERETGNDSVTIPKSLRYITVDQQADKLPHICTLLAHHISDLGCALLHTYSRYSGQPARGQAPANSRWVCHRDARAPRRTSC